MTRHVLIGLAYSPWTERARWALDHHGIPHAFESYLPVVGEPALRLRARRLTGRVSVPVLLGPGGPVWDSRGIAEHADRTGRGDPLCAGHERALDAWMPGIEGALDAARSLVLRAIEASPLASAESVPLPMPRALKGPTARFGTAVLRWKYGSTEPDADAEARVAALLDRARDAVRPGYVDGTFSLVDIALAGVVQAIQPVAERFLPLGPGTRAAWTRPALAERFAEVIAWRDSLYERHRRAAGAAAP
ncbi:MAG: glutathione S-transferase [Polyangiaceae bacterium]|nr:glutathione S-transferase [Polyangiaceae bacterium]